MGALLVHVEPRGGKVSWKIKQPARAAWLRGAPAYTPKTPWTAVRASLAAVAILALSVAGAGLALWIGNIAGTPGAALWRQDMGALATLAIWQSLAVVLTVLASALLGGKVVDVLALRAPAGPRMVYVKAVLLMAVLQVAVGAVQYSFFPQDMYADLRPLVRLFGEQWILALLVVGVGAPLSEELLFRGFLLSALARSRLGFAGGAAHHDSLWTALHAGYSAGGHRRGVR